MKTEKEKCVELFIGYSTSIDLGLSICIEDAGRMLFMYIVKYPLNHATGFIFDSLYRIHRMNRAVMGCVLGYDYR